MVIAAQFMRDGAQGQFMRDRAQGQFMRDRAQSRSIKHCTVSNCCVVIYIFLSYANDADDAAGGQVNTEMGLWHSPSEVGLPA